MAAKTETAADRRAYYLHNYLVPARREAARDAAQLARLCRSSSTSNRALADAANKALRSAGWLAGFAHQLAAK